MATKAKKFQKLNPLEYIDIMKLLNTLYEQSINGVRLISPPIEQFANDYISKHDSIEKAAKSMINNQIVKCTTSGVLSGLGGIVTLPVSIPANIASVLYVQMRMISCAAYMGGYDLKSDQVQTFVYACLAGVSINEITKRFGIKLGEKFAEKGIEKIPGHVCAKINSIVGFRLLTKFGETGLINLGKLIPLVGAGINGGLDLAETKVIADRAYKMFIKNNFNVGTFNASEFENV